MVKVNLTVPGYQQTHYWSMGQIYFIVSNVSIYFIDLILYDAIQKGHIHLTKSRGTESVMNRVHESGKRLRLMNK